jgi:hypothetical protein
VKDGLIVPKPPEAALPAAVALPPVRAAPTADTPAATRAAPATPAATYDTAGGLPRSAGALAWLAWKTFTNRSCQLSRKRRHTSQAKRSPHMMKAEENFAWRTSTQSTPPRRPGSEDRLNMIHSSPELATSHGNRARNFLPHHSPRQPRALHHVHTSRHVRLPPSRCLSAKMSLS